ncbi:glucokinase [Acerihabitans arboris]|uniref:Glucokinase n=1 Tax=Acerihabitans arboris TaxID=2691583 RepID=A0A845SSU2_9GAMM|nr:glucokinase [Acerihabitans arboris]NDL65916.1 glucokinase [Acerihabitans arboris]
MTKYALVGDVGGTNARLALCDLDNGAISHIHTYSGKDYATLEAVITHYLSAQKVEATEACIAIACPITDDWVDMTNSSWAFSIKAMKSSLGLSRLEVINDFTAVSMAVPMLTPDDVAQFGGGEAQADRPIAVYGAGTGLGVCHLVQLAEHWVSLPGEGGHVDFAPTNQEETDILAVLGAEFGHVSAERVLSGPGLVNLYRSIVTIDGRAPDQLEPHQVTEQAVDGSNDDCRRALSLFCVLMGRFGGNLALNMGTFGGVYIAGGLVPRFLEFFRASGFRAAFEDKGRFDDYLRAIPVYLIRHEQPGLLGAGAHMRQLMGLKLQVIA